MAGATFGLGDTFIAATDNPAGLAMTLNQADLSITRNWAQDNRVQNFSSAIPTSGLGFAVSRYPWGASFGYFVPYREASSYLLPEIPDPVGLDVSVREFHLSLARVFLKDRLSIGTGLIFGQADTEYKPMTPWIAEVENHSYSLGLNFGAMLQLPSRFLLGLAYQPGMHFDGNSDLLTPGLAGFFQPVATPSRLGLGLGWIPNRFFRADFSILGIGKTPGSSPLRSESASLGDSTSIHPRFGTAYLCLDYPNFRATVYSGLYFEAVRVSDARDRLHFTAGIQTKAWVLSLGAGLDASAGYRNYLFTAGIDVLRAAQKLELIPRFPQPAQGGALPRVSQLSDIGLPRPLVRNWRPGPALDPVQIGLDLPQKIQEKAEKVGEELRNLGTDAVDNIVGLFDEPEPPKKKKPLRKRPLRKRRPLRPGTPVASPIPNPK